MLAESDARPFSWLSMLARSWVIAALELSVGGVANADETGEAVVSVAGEAGEPEYPGADGAGTAFCSPSQTTQYPPRDRGQ